MSDRHVLIVDDSADTREMYAEYLGMCGFRVSQAANGHQALKSAATLRPDAIVIDLTMPGLDGWEVIRRLRDGGGDGAQPKILVLSGRARESNEDGAGHDAYLIKPCLPDDLERALRRVLNEGSEPRF